MMVSITTCYKKSRKIFFVNLFFSLMVLIYSTYTYAESSSLHIKTADLVLEQDYYFLNADIDINFNPNVEDALSKGVPLTFILEFQVVSPRKYWFDDEVVTLSQPITLSYHALSRQYLVIRGTHQQSFPTFQQAKEELSRVRDWQVLDQSLIKKGENFAAVLRIRLDQSQLPKPLQVEAIGSEEWEMVSQRYRWIPILENK